MHIGIHISIRGGYLAAAQNAAALGYGAFQFFPKNPRSLAVKSFDRYDAEACRQFCRQHDLLSIAHAPYPLNLAAHDPKIRQACLASLINDLEICEATGAIGIVTHFGKFKEKNPLQGYQNIIQLLNETLKHWEGKAMILLENQAGEGGMMGTTLEELTHVRSLCAKPDQIGFCFDTCHAYASGLWTGTNWAPLLKKGNDFGYFTHLKAVHANDSVYSSGSHRDRHAAVGCGSIPEPGWKAFLSTPELSRVPVILETPEVPISHRAQIQYIHSLKENIND